MTSTEACVKLAQSLPPQLLRFFTRYRPQLIGSQGSSSPLDSQPQLSLAPPPLPNQSNGNPPTHQLLEPSSLPNPFKCHKHPVTGKWHGPVYSLRLQGELVKLARAHGVEELLPFTVKGTDTRIQKRKEHGLRVKGTGVGQKVKGKIWERTMRNRLEDRKQAMLGMPQLIQDWKDLKRSRGWKNWPK